MVMTVEMVDVRNYSNKMFSSKGIKSALLRPWQFKGLTFNRCSKSFHWTFLTILWTFRSKKAHSNIINIWTILFYCNRAHQHIHKFLNQIWLKCAANSNWWQNTLERNVRHRERKIKENRHETQNCLSLSLSLPLCACVYSVYPFEFVCRLTFGSFLRKFSVKIS